PGSIARRTSTSRSSSILMIVPTATFGSRYCTKSQAGQVMRSRSAGFRRRGVSRCPHDGQKRKAGSLIPDDYNAAMSILKVARMGHPVLRTRARAIDVGEVKSPRIQQLIDDMFETMTEYQGVGLAAPQVHESVRLFVAGFAPAPGDEDDEMERVPLMALINPEIAAVGDESVEDW